MESAKEIIDDIDEFYFFNTERSLCDHLTRNLSKKYNLDDKRDLNTTYYMTPDIQVS